MSPAPAVVARRSAGATVFPFEGFLDRVRAALHPGAGALLTGPEGIGRSTVLDRLAVEAAGRGARVLRAAPTPADRDAPYGALIDVLRPVPDLVFDDLDAPRREALRAALLRGEGGAAPTGEDERSARRRELAVAEAVASVLAGLAAERPLLLVLDDTQELDLPSARALGYVAHRAAALGVTLLGALRTESAGDRRSSGGPDPRDARSAPLRRVRRFQVPPLSDPQIAELLRARHPFLAGLSAIVTLAAGNPGTALELADAAADPGRMDAGRMNAGRIDAGDAGDPGETADPIESADLLGASPTPVLPPRLLDREMAPVRRLPRAVAEALLLLALSPGESLTPAELAAAGVVDPLAAVGAAQEQGLLRHCPEERIAVRSRLLGAALRQAAGPLERARAHERLATGSVDPLLRARHLAHARPAGDPEASDVLDAAAALARRRGDLVQAQELALLAARRTPADRPGQRQRRRLDAAGHAVAAGRHAEARAVAWSVLSDSDDTADRVRARLLLLDTVGQALDDVGGLIAAGINEAEGEPALQAQLYRWSAVRELLGGRTATAARAAARAAGLAARAGDPVLGAQALGELATVLALRGRPRQAEAVLRRAGRLEDQANGRAETDRARAPGDAAELGRADVRRAGLRRADVGPADVRRADVRPAVLRPAGAASVDAGGSSLRRRRALLELDADRGVQAMRLLSSLEGADRCVAGRPGDVGAATGLEDQVATLVAMVRVQVRLGECRAARENAARCVALIDAAGVHSPLGAYALGLAESAGGSVERAVAAARTAVEGHAADGDRLFEVRALGVLGEALLAEDDPASTAQAVEVLQRARKSAAAMGLADPDSVRRLADLVEALALQGEHDEAAAVLVEAQAQVRSWTGDAAPSSGARFGGSAAAALCRAEAVALSARGHVAEGVDLLRQVTGTLCALSLPLDQARALIAWAAVERRARHRAAARAALEDAERLCRRHGAAPLLARARAEADRLAPGSRAASGTGIELTAAERRLARLIADGATNREAAAALFVSVKTVEGTLSRVYRKLGVRSRTALARAVMEGQVS